MKSLKLSQRMKQAGFTLVELLVVLALIVLLSSLYIFNDDSSKSKGKVMYSSMVEYSNAMVRAKTDVACHFNRVDALWLQASASTSSCGLDLRPQWQGPYTRPANVDATGNVVLANLGPTLTLSIRSAAGGSGTQWFVRASNVPNEFIQHALVACNGSATATGKCVGATGAAGLGTFDLQFDETRV